LRIWRQYFGRSCVGANDNAGESWAADVVETLAAPDLTVTSPGSSRVQLPAPAGGFPQGTSYQVRRSLAAAGGYADLAPTVTQDGHFFDDTVTAETAYYYQARAVRGWSRSDWSAAQSGIPGTPCMVSPTVISQIRGQGPGLAVGSAGRARTCLGAAGGVPALRTLAQGLGGKVRRRAGRAVWKSRTFSGGRSPDPTLAAGTTFATTRSALPTRTSAGRLRKSAIAAARPGR
jgi:hypothetical protein